MKLIRIIPSLLLKDNNLFKGTNFDHHNYVGDVFNALKIFSEKKAHEIILLDIGARKNKKLIHLDLIKKIRQETFVPLCVGGGISDIDSASRIINEGVEKIIVNASTLANLDFVNQVASKFGSQSSTVSIDVIKDDNEYLIYSHLLKKTINLDIVKFIKNCESAGAGEIILTAVHREGTGLGYDIDLYKIAENLVKIPIIASGGGKDLNSMREVFDKTKLSAAAAGNNFVYYGSRKAVLINYPDKETIVSLMEHYEDH